MGHNYKQVAKTLFGFEEVIAGELRNLGVIDKLRFEAYLN